MKSTVSRSRSASMSAASGVSRASVYRVGRGGQAGDRAEVALAVDQLVAQHPVLGHAHQRVVDAHVAVRMVALHRAADDGGALASSPSPGSRPMSFIATRMRRCDGLQAVAHVGQGPADDDAHRVRQVAVAQFVLDVQRRHGGGPPSPFRIRRRRGRIAGYVGGRQGRVLAGSKQRSPRKRLTRRKWLSNSHFRRVSRWGMRTRPNR